MTQFVVTNDTSNAREVFQDQGRATRYAQAMRALYPAIQFAVWAETQGSVHTNTVRERVA